MDVLGDGTGSPAAGGADQARAQLEAFMGRLRDLDQQVQQTMQEMPALGPIAQQMRQLIRRAVQEAVKTAPAQTASAQAVPTAGQ
jgi:ribosomal 50S subunit-associated protein YjgA (DUF615 family)